MRTTFGLLAASVLALTPIAAYAACVPFGGGAPNEAGCATLDPLKAKCEQRASQKTMQLYGALSKCRSKLVTAVAKGGTFDQEACEAAAIAKLVDKTDVAPCPCVNLPVVASTMEFLSNANGPGVFCDGYDSPTETCIGTTPYDPGGDDHGCLPADDRAVKIELAINKCLIGFVKDWDKCHTTWSRDYVKTSGAPTFDLQACEIGPIPSKPGKAAGERFTQCVNKAGIHRGPAPDCNEVLEPNFPAFVQTVWGAGGEYVYCEE